MDASQQLELFDLSLHVQELIDIPEGEAVQIEPVPFFVEFKQLELDLFPQTLVWIASQSFELAA
jgi:hypothetical protein